MVEYPRFYRRAGLAIRQDDRLTTWIIALQPEVLVAQRYRTVWPSEDQLAEHLRDFEMSTPEKFKEFVYTFYQQVERERVSQVSKSTN